MLHTLKSFLSKTLPFLGILLGSFIAAFAITIFFIPNNLIDGGTVGASMIFGRIFGTHLIPYALVFVNVPFLIAAFSIIGKRFVLRVFFSTISFSSFLILIPHLFPQPFTGETIEVIVIGGALLGVGIGLIIRFGGCLDGTEISGIIANKYYGFTVGQVVFGCNIFIFTAAGFAFNDWHPPLLSLIAFLVVIKVMDAVIVGLDETKSLLVISQKPDEIRKLVVYELGLGLTVMYGRGGFSKKDQEILYIITERLQLAKVKDLIFSIDPRAFVAIQNLHEVSAGKGSSHSFLKAKRRHRHRRINP